eukprot:CAMPEP_0183746348 /NCGR_PEP_ID=MMETSP0737-20130205/66708_1 /TAXON_ID=385413 /ORGANISM="Thalassiosira miniscula, Strain CCMP1093" /LENGTH=331 /DNA_ID=CAMNT_0025982041 /DNA_START=798 /DNA_END=1793 /DNA_ORIENTATION=-
MSWKIPKTVMGDKIEWDISKIPGKRKKGTWSGKDDQLWRCRKTKKFEASLLNNLPHGACFVDAGAHFGDTVITMALYARDTLQRHDIRFVAIEPNRRKAQYIEECAAANGFESDTLKVISCVLGDDTVIGGARVRREDGKEWCKFDGRTSYEKVVGEYDGLGIGASTTTPQKEASLALDSVPVANQNNGKNMSDEESCSSSSDSSSSTSSHEHFLNIHQLDDFFDIIHPLGFLHIDVEGWEAKVLTGASKLLTTPADTIESSQCYILAETFNQKEAQRRGAGFSQTHEEDILKVMSSFSFIRGKDVVDGERNMFFARLNNQPPGLLVATAS